MSFLKKVNNYVVPNTGHTDTFAANTWYQISTKKTVDNAILLLSNGLTLSIVKNKMYVLSNRSTNETTIQTYSSSDSSFYLQCVGTELGYTWLGDVKDAFTEGVSLSSTAQPSTYKFPAGTISNTGVSVTPISGIYMGTSATPPQGLPSGSVYIYYGADSGSGSSSSDS